MCWFKSKLLSQSARLKPSKIDENDTQTIKSNGSDHIIYGIVLSKLTLKRMYKIPIGSAISELRGIFFLLLLFKKENHIFLMEENVIHSKKKKRKLLCFFFGFMINLMQFFLSVMTKKSYIPYDKVWEWKS